MKYNYLNNLIIYKPLGKSHLIKGIIYYSFMLILLISCSYNQVEINKKTDQVEGRKFAEDIFDKLMLYQDNKIILSAATGEKKKLNNLLNKIKKKMGVMVSYDIESVETKRVEKNGFFTTISYLIKIHVKYKKGDSDEVITLIKRGEDKILINGYNVFSDLML